MSDLTLNRTLSLASMSAEDGCLELEVVSNEPITSYNTAYFPWLQQFSDLGSVTVRDAKTGIDYVFSGLSDADFEYDQFTSTYLWRFAHCCPPFTGTIHGHCPRPCFAAGTRIATPAGARAVEDLAAGDTVSLAYGGCAPIRWMGHRRSRNAAIVRLSRGSLGDGVPSRDLLVSPDHAIALGGCLVAAELLVDGTTILHERLDDAVFFHVELEQHGVLLAEDAPAESYLDTGNRAQFANCPIGEAAAAPDRRCTPCLEILTGGARLDAILDALPGRRASLRAA